MRERGGRGRERAKKRDKGRKTRRETEGVREAREWENQNVIEKTPPKFFEIGTLVMHVTQHPRFRSTAEIIQYVVDEQHKCDGRVFFFILACMEYHPSHWRQFYCFVIWPYNTFTLSMVMRSLLDPCWWRWMQLLCFLTGDQWFSFWSHLMSSCNVYGISILCMWTQFPSSERVKYLAALIMLYWYLWLEYVLCSSVFGRV